MWEGRAATIRGVMYGCVGHKIIATGSISPYVAKVKVMAHFVGAGTAKVKGCLGRTCCAKGVVINYNAIGSAIAPGKLRVA